MDQELQQWKKVKVEQKSTLGTLTLSLSNAD